MKHDAVIGVDEVGRGCLAGDVVVCAYTFNPSVSAEVVGRAIELAADSKSFSTRRKRAAGLPALEAAGLWAFARRDPDDIARLNIRGATLEAMAEAAWMVRAMVGRDLPVVFDGRDVPQDAPENSQACVKGDTKIAEIAAASMLAKVMRDREMEEMDRRYPGYGFAIHAGYGTRAHREAIASLGLCPIHRVWANKFVR